VTERRSDRHGARRRGSIWLAAPLALASLVLFSWGLVVVFRHAPESEPDSPSVLSGVTAHIPGWPASADPGEGTGEETTTTTAIPTTATAVSTTLPIVYQPIAEPTRVVVPAIGVDAVLVPVGLKANGEMETPPFGLAGWYTPGPVPGAAGPAVIVAHVDSRKGPDIFFRLEELQPDDQILVYGAEGERAVFSVEGKEEELKTELPVERIWNDTPYPVLRLITCGGEFDYSVRHYRSNVIVYASLAG